MTVLLLLLFIVGLLFLGILLGIGLAALFRTEVVDWFKPGQSRVGQPPRGIKVVGIWFIILLPVGLLILWATGMFSYHRAEYPIFLTLTGMLILPSGFGLIRYQKWGWWLAIIETCLVVLSIVIIGSLFLYSPPFVIRVAFGPAILIFTWTGLYLLRKDVRRAFGV